MRERPDRDRWLALGILAGALVLAYFVLVHFWWTVPMLEVSENIDSMQRRDLRARMELQQAPQVRKRLQELQVRASRIPGFMTERSPELATASLVQRLETAVNEASPGNKSCAILNRSPTTDPRPQRFPRVVAQVRLRCGNSELATVLYSLENGSPRLFVDNLNILSTNFFVAQQQSKQGAGLDVSFDLYGYLQPTAATPGPAAPQQQAGGADASR
ncbi:type II secretion system protein GspM [Luteimonas aquatica]|uniref:type II secretion system protein GspM n=1 Tax=Luteimonas aquatica TaxID=450364 RepID=UPI001F5704CA|nr:type II secretion system protein GspM [Luteimonas aquatica]